MSASQSGIGDIHQPGAEKLEWSTLFARTYSVYGRNFWPYFRIALVPALAAYFFQYIFHLLTLRLLQGTFPTLSPKWVAFAIVQGWVRGAGFWIISTFFFAAISSSLVGPSEDAPAVADAYTLPRKRVGGVLAVALLTWTLFWLGRMLAGLAMLGFSRGSNLRNHYQAYEGLYDLMLILVGGLVAKFGLAIPEMMHDLTISAGSALKKSLKHTAGWELFFMMFLIKSAIVAYGAYWIAGAVLDWGWSHWNYGAQLYSWIDWTIYLSIVAALEPPLFIAFSLLWRESQNTPT